MPDFGLVRLGPFTIFLGDSGLWEVWYEAKERCVASYGSKAEALAYARGWNDCMGSAGLR